MVPDSKVDLGLKSSCLESLAGFRPVCFFIAARQHATARGFDSWYCGTAVQVPCALVLSLYSRIRACLRRVSSSSARRRGVLRDIDLKTVSDSIKPTRIFFQERHAHVIFCEVFFVHKKSCWIHVDGGSPRPSTNPQTHRLKAEEPGGTAQSRAAGDRGRARPRARC